MGASERAAALAVVVLPAGAALLRLAQRPTWREDAALLRDVALVGTGPGGGISTALAQIAGALPLGTLSFRAALVSVVALAIASRLAFSIALRLLRGAQRGAAQLPSATAKSRPPLPAWLSPAFAAIAVCGAALSPSLQLEATVAGGATTAAALVLGALALAARAADGAEETSRGRDLVAAGALAGAALAERPLAAVAALAAVTALLFTHRVGVRLEASRAARWARRHAPAAGAAAPVTRSPVARVAPIPGRALRLAAIAAAISAALGALPALVRPFAPGRVLDLGAASLPGSGDAALVATALAAWVVELGWTPLGLAGLGAVILALRPATRPGAAALAAVVLLDVLVPAPLAGGAVAEPAAALRTLAVVALAVLAAVGLHEGVARLLRAGVPYARPAAVLFVAFQATLVALASEKAAEVADRTAQRGAEEWLDASRDALEARSVALVRRPHKALRLWAAQITGGFRPDVVVASVELLPRGGVASELLAAEPRAHDLVRTIALRGAPDEFSLSELAEARALHVEPDRGWDARTASHAELDGVWLHFVAHPIGRTDRKRSALDSVAPLARVLAAIARTAAPDPATTDVVSTTVREQALLLARLGERDTARALALAARELGTPTTVGSPAAAVLLAALEATSPHDAPSPLPVRRTGHR